MGTGAEWHWELDLTPTTLPDAPVLDPEQELVANHRDGPLLVLAGPGTGKTSTIVEAVVRRLTDVDRPLSQDEVLVLTFGRRAAGELRDRLARRLPGRLPTVATFHALAYGLISDRAVGEVPRLLSGAEDDVRIRELLRGAIDDGSIAWPAELAEAVGTLGLANEIRAVLARARALDLDPVDLARIGRAANQPAWVAVAELARQDSEVMVLENVCDYAELLHRAVLQLRESEMQHRMHGRFRAIYVDEYQDTDPLQVAMLHALVGPDCSLVAVGDPDQSIYAFRGADIRAIVRFPEEFRTATGEPAPVVVLRHTRRFGQQLREAATRILGNRPLTVHGSGAISRDLLTAHRNPSCQLPGGEVLVQSYPSESSRDAGIAEQIRRAHIDEQVPWEQMAILVRTARHIPALQRMLTSAEVPTMVAADERPLRAEPAVAVLLTAARAAVDLPNLSTELALELLLGPLGGLDAGDLRALGRQLRRILRGMTEPGLLPSSSELLRDALCGTLPDLIQLDGPQADSWRGLQRLRALLVRAHEQIEQGQPAAVILWTLWSGDLADGGRAHGWPERLRRAALRGSRTADREIDAVLALFDTADRTQQRYRGIAGIAFLLSALQAQQIPAEPVAERSLDLAAVRILTAHRAKGLEWDRVWIVGAQEGEWPDLRQRGTVLQSERLSATGLGEAPTVSELLAEERRLFYVACTRARERVTITTVASAEQGDDEFSRFVHDLALPIQPMAPRPREAASMTALVARLRHTLQDPTASPALREAAAQRLAGLAAQRDDDGTPLVPAADPRQWWGARGTSPGVSPVRPADEPIALSGSGLGALNTCPLRWFLDHEAAAESVKSTATRFGSVVHAVAEGIGSGEVPADHAMADALLNRVWRELRFDAPWQSDVERDAAREALSRFLDYHLAAARTLVTTEREYQAEVELPTPTGSDRVRLRGFLDRVERDEQGRAVAIDLKTTRSAVSAAELATFPQLGVYQLLLQSDEQQRPGGAALVQLRLEQSKGSSAPKVQFQDPIPEQGPSWVARDLGIAAHTVRTESFDAVAGQHCKSCPHTWSCPTTPQGQQVLS
jgi:superfamily I DNA/RNA helicase/RecB family exonuclease